LAASDDSMALQEREVEGENALELTGDGCMILDAKRGKPPAPARANENESWKILLLGQFLSLMIALVDMNATVLVEKCEINAPAFQYFWVFFGLSFYFLVRLAKRRTAKKPSQTQSSVEPLSIPDTIFEEKKKVFPCTSVEMQFPWWFYLVVTALDVCANYLTLLAFRYTSITSVALNRALTVPGAMITSLVLFGSDYGRSHASGAVLCCLGVVICAAVDLRDIESEYPRKTLGDAFAIVAGILSGFNDVLEELVVRKSSAQEYLGFVGFFGIGLAAFQLFVFEGESVQSIFAPAATCHLQSALLLLVSFFVFNFVAYVGTAHFLVSSEAALLNLSFLSSDIYATLFRVLVDNAFPKPVFFLSLLLIFSGVYIYTSAPSPMVSAERMERHFRVGPTPRVEFRARGSLRTVT